MTRPEARTGRILKILKATYPEVKTQLHYRNAFELLVATILSAQCTDKQVNSVTGKLFAQLASPAAFAAAPLDRIERLIRPTGFFRSKAKNLQECSRMLIRRHHGKVPDRLPELVKLAGVGRKTANVVLGAAFGIPGMVVDTHVARISRRLGLAASRDPAKIELELMRLMPAAEWNDFSLRLIFFGREICNARKPRCLECPLRRLCPYPDKTA